MPFQFQKLEIPEVILIQARRFEDHRGVFAETYKKSDFLAHGIPQVFVQDNFSHSTCGVIRGLHYQDPPKGQGKLVMVLRGEIFDVAVDIRKGSPTFGQWIGVTLSAQNLNMLYIPIGFAHGYCTLSDEADLLYKVTEEYCPELDRGICWNDSEISISWPVAEPILSVKDAQLPLLRASTIHFTYEAA